MKSQKKIGLLVIGMTLLMNSANAADIVDQLRSIISFDTKKCSLAETTNTPRQRAILKSINRGDQGIFGELDQKYRSVKNIPKDLNEAINWFTYSLMGTSDESRDESYKTALNWYELAETGKNEKALEKLECIIEYIRGHSYRSGLHGLEINEDLAFVHLQNSANSGYVFGEFFLSKMYRDRRAIAANDGRVQSKEDLTNHEKWALRAAKQGYAPLTNYIAFEYFQYISLGGFDEPDIAIELLTKSAKQGHLNSQVDLGVAYGDLEQSYASFLQAEYWLKIAAERGSSVARYELALLYKDSRPERYLIDGLMWAILSENDTEASAKEIESEYRKELDSELIDKAEKLAVECASNSFKSCGVRE